MKHKWVVIEEEDTNYFQNLKEAMNHVDKKIQEADEYAESHGQYPHSIYSIVIAELKFDIQHSMGGLTVKDIK